jgi:hypothetical protein
MLLTSKSRTQTGDARCRRRQAHVRGLLVVEFQDLQSSNRVRWALAIAGARVKAVHRNSDEALEFF